MSANKKTYKIAVMPGDGTGPEVINEGVKVLKSLAKKTGLSFDWVPYDLGGERYKKTGEILPDSVLAEFRKVLQPGATLYLGSGVTIAVANGGRLLAEGTLAAPIRFTVAPGSGVSWGGLTINGAVGSPETRIAYARFESNSTRCIEVAGGTVFLDHLSFGTTTQQYLALDGASFQVQNCVFPTGTALFELVHGTGGIKSGGRGIFLRNFFGAAQSLAGNYNDVLDFTGGNRDLNQPIVQFYDNVFIGSGDDLLDLDGTDAWIEGNIFLHAHKNGSPDTSSAISGGNDSGNTSEITIVGNFIYDCDHAALAKQGNFYTLLNNTIVHQTHIGGQDTAGAVLCLADDSTIAEGAGAYFEGNIIYDAEALVQNRISAVVTFTNNLMPFAWGGPGGGNSTNSPLLHYIPQLSETTNFTSWSQAQVVRDWFSPRPGSPAQGFGPNGRDLGAAVPLFCCGAGGGRMWMEEHLGTRINLERTAEALKKDPDTICVTCPYCMTMLQDGLKDKNAEKVIIRDIAEIVAEGLRFNKLL